MTVSGVNELISRNERHAIFAEGRLIYLALELRPFCAV